MRASRRLRWRRAALDRMARGGRKVLRAFSGSFFLVTRFLPPVKRAQVELVYAAVRYPDEIADTFPMPPGRKLSLLHVWESAYRDAIRLPDTASRLRARVPWIVAGFAAVARAAAIPEPYYPAFLQAMRRDIEPAPFASFAELIDRYVFGSAIVVGYFLAHIYGAAPGRSLEEARDAAAELGIALQLTNFARDVAEDRVRGRLYLPLDLLRTRGLSADDCFAPAHIAALRGCVHDLAAEAERRYVRAAAALTVFAADTRPAIGACINVYRRLNGRILNSASVPAVRESVPVSEKWGALPVSKYWRVPLAFVGGM